jgi:hypothetical protein
LAFWARIVGVLLVVLGLVILMVPFITYHWRERILHTPSVDVTTRRERVIVIPPIVGVLVIGAGVVTFVMASGRV